LGEIINFSSANISGSNTHANSHAAEMVFALKKIDDVMSMLFNVIRA
jgi:hypothetical protein